MRPSKYKIGPSLDSELLDRLEKALHGSNLVENILSGHLLIERALTTCIAVKLARPEILKEAQWSFHQKLSLYIGLYNPTEWMTRRMRGFNRLRNAIAHSLDDDPELAVRKYLPWEKEREEDADYPRPENAIDEVRMAVGGILMFELGGIGGWSIEPVDWEVVGPLFEGLGKSFDGPKEDELK